VRVASTPNANPFRYDVRYNLGLHYTTLGCIGQDVTLTDRSGPPVGGCRGRDA
jgi:hypothetical protein